MFLNEVTIIGNLTRDVELKSLPSGVALATFSVATNHVYKDKDGNKKETVEFHNVVVFGRQAETTAQYMSKGSQVLVKGRLQTRNWEDKETGKKMYRTEIVADRIQFGNNRNNNEQSQGGYTQPTNAPSSTPAEQGVEYPNDDIDPADIPF